MKRLLSLTCSLAAAMLLTTGCGDSSVKASELVDSAKSSLEDMDLSKLGVDGMKDKVTELAGGLTSKFDEIKDKASAMDVTKSIEPVVDQLSKLKDALGDKMPSLDSLKDSVSSLTEKFSGDSSIMEVLQPVLDKLKSLVG